MSDLEPLVCVDCVARVDATSEEAEGWTLVLRSALEGDRSDDMVWKCPDCATFVENAAFHEQCTRVVRLNGRPDPGLPDFDDAA